MGLWNVARAIFGLPLIVVSKYIDSQGYIWSRDHEGFYFKSITEWEPIDGDPCDLRGVTYRWPIRAKYIPDEVKEKLISDGAGFVGETYADQFVERWGGRGGPLAILNQKITTTSGTV